MIDHPSTNLASPGPGLEGPVDATAPFTGPREYPYRVAGNKPVTPVICELTLAPVTATMPFRAGQYVLLGDRNYRLEPRSYSVANRPRPDGTISLLVTRVEGGTTSNWAHRLRPDDEVLLDGPYGRFVLAPGCREAILLLAAGSGLAPIRALGEALAVSTPRRQTTLFFSGRRRVDAIDRARFETWQCARPDFRYLLTLTRDPDAPRHGRIPGLLPGTLGDLSGREVYAAGPPGFVADCAAAARALGAKAADVHTEEFFTDPQPWTDTEPQIPAQPNRRETTG